MQKIDILKKVQDIEFEALAELDLLCKKNEITYFLRGGSTLGAVKYSGFVPWDDDIDIALPREDYLRLIDSMPIFFGEKFQFVSYQRTPNSHCYFPRVLLQEKYRKKYGLPKNNERGLVLVDILPLDGMPENLLCEKMHILLAYCYRALASLWTLDVKDTINMHSRRYDKILRMLYHFNIHHLYGQDSVYRKLDNLYSKYDFFESKRVGMLSSSKLEKEIVPFDWYGKGTEMSFRSLRVLVPEKYDLYLKQLFGDDYAVYEPTANKKKSHILWE